MDSTGKALPNGTSNATKHSGVIVAGLSGPGTPLGSFQYLFVQLLDFLSAKGVDVINETATVKPAETLTSLNYYLERLPTSSASGLVYMSVERPYNYRYNVRLQCFDHAGKLLWEEKEAHGSFSETGASNGVLKAIEKKLESHIGHPGLPLKQEKSVEGAKAQK